MFKKSMLVVAFFAGNGLFASLQERKACLTEASSVPLSDEQFNIIIEHRMDIFRYSQELFHYGSEVRNDKAGQNYRFSNFEYGLDQTGCSRMVGALVRNHKDLNVLFALAKEKFAQDNKVALQADESLAVKYCKQSSCLCLRNSGLFGGMVWAHFDQQLQSSIEKLQDPVQKTKTCCTYYSWK